MQGPPQQQQMPPQQQQQRMQYSPAAFAPTYSPGDPNLAPPPAYATGPYGQMQQPTMVLPRRGVPMWLVGVVSGVAALMVLVVVYLLVVPPAHPTTTRAPAANTGAAGTAATTGTGPFGAARVAFNAAITPTSSTAPTLTATPPTTATTTATPPTTATATDTAPSATVTAPATTTTAVATAPTATATATATHVATPATDKGFLTLITVPKCDAWSDNGTPMGTCPINNKPLPVGTHRITLTTNAPKASKTVSVIIISGQLANPGLIMLSP
jgi:hypothetical protein